MADIRNLSTLAIKFRGTFFLDFEDKEAKCIVDNFLRSVTIIENLKKSFLIYDKRSNNSQWLFCTLPKLTEQFSVRSKSRWRKSNQDFARYYEQQFLQSQIAVKKILCFSAWSDALIKYLHHFMRGGYGEMPKIFLSG